jgi:hypothetical protein
VSRVIRPNTGGSVYQPPKLRVLYGTERDVAMRLFEEDSLPRPKEEIANEFVEAITQLNIMTDNLTNLAGVMDPGERMGWVQKIIEKQEELSLLAEEFEESDA